MLRDSERQCYKHERLQLERPVLDEAKRRGVAKIPREIFTAGRESSGLLREKVYPRR